MRIRKPESLTYSSKPSRLAPLWAVSMSVAAMAVLSSCGGPGEAAKQSCSLCGSMSEIRGAISSKTGSQTAMSGWAVASIERDTGIARVGEVDGAGLFSLKNFRTGVPQTLALFSPDYILQSVLSISGTTAGTINQFIVPTSAFLPQLINNGPIITFQNDKGISVSKDMAADPDGDLIPDGAKHIQGLTLLQEAAAADTDLDDTLNERDPDIDGDGVINRLDPDDDGDGIRDAFDGDANADYSNDSAEEDTDLYFTEGVEYISVEYEMQPLANGTTETTLKFLAKVRDDVTPNTVQIRGAPTLLNSATFLAADPATGEMIEQPWNRLLGDDGVSDDGNPGDRVFAKRVKLAEGQAPRSYEAIFFQLSFGSEAEPWFLEFPYMFPDLSPQAVSANYDPLTRTVVLIGAPFDSVQEYVWIIVVYDEEGKSVFTSQAVVGTEREFSIPAQVLVEGKSYTYEVVAQTLDKIPGHPAYVIHSVKAALE